jgi:transposase
MKSLSFVCGVDVSKDTLDLYYNDGDGRLCYRKAANDSQGHAAVLEALGKERTYVMESTGPYYLRFAFSLKSAGADVRVENPVTLRRFMQMNRERNKSDRTDARWLYRYGVEREAAPWKQPPEEQLHGGQLMGAMDLCTRQLTMVSNQLHALEQLPLVCKEVRKSLERTKQFLTKERKRMEALLQVILEGWQGEQMKSVGSIPGLGKRAVALLIVFTDGFRKVQNHCPLIALAGLAPREHTSGTTIRGKRGIAKGATGTSETCCTCAP